MSSSMFMSWLVVVGLVAMCMPRGSTRPPSCWPPARGADAARELAVRFGLSQRQARRYVERAAAGPVAVPQATVGVHRQAAGAAGGAGARTRRGTGRTISSVVAQALEEFLSRAPSGASARVSDRRSRASSSSTVTGRRNCRSPTASWFPNGGARMRAAEEASPSDEQAQRSTPGCPRPGRRNSRRSAPRPRRCTRTPSSSGLRSPRSGCSSDDGHSGATLVRPALEQLRDLVAQVPVDVVLVYSPDRLARKYAYQALLIEEFAKAGTR